MPRLSEPEARAFIGTAKSGKTYTMQALMAATLRASQTWKFLVLDLNAETPHAEATRGNPPLSFTRVEGPEDAHACLADQRRLVCVTPPMSAPVGTKSHDVRPYADLANDLARLAIETPGPVCLVLPEAHTSCRENYPLPYYVGQIAHRSRHVGAGVWWDTQHFADVSKDLLRASVSGIYLFANAGDADLDRVKKMGGPELLAAVSECGRRAAGGQPGWHVRLETLNRRPPYTLRRV